MLVNDDEKGSVDGEGTRKMSVGHEAGGQGCGKLFPPDGEEARSPFVSVRNLSFPEPEMGQRLSKAGRPGARAQECCMGTSRAPA